MPLYEIECLSCKRVEETLAPAGSAPEGEVLTFLDYDPVSESAIERACQNCGATSFRRILSNTTFQLKGNGWYVTDYKK
jgi:hypothetical protein